MPYTPSVKIRVCTFCEMDGEGGVLRKRSPKIEGMGQIKLLGVANLLPMEHTHHI